MFRILPPRYTFTCIILMFLILIIKPETSFAVAQYVKNGVEYSDEIQYRDVYATTASALASQMKLLDSERKSKRGGFWWAKPKYNWKFYYNKEPAVCSISHAHITLHVTFTLPRWVNKATADKKLQRKWDAFLDNIKYYEIGYAEIYRETARKVQRELKKINANACQAVGKKGNKRGREIINDLGTEYKIFHAQARRSKRYLLDYSLLLED